VLEHVVIATLALSGWMSDAGAVVSADSVVNAVRSDSVAVRPPGLRRPRAATAPT
jgi:hypothetical protein